MPKISTGKTPAPELVKATRERAGLSQSAAAALVYVTLRAWQRWEAAADLEHHRDMPAGLWELFTLKTSRERAAAKRVRHRRFAEATA